MEKVYRLLLGLERFFWRQIEVERLHDLIITSLGNGMSLTDLLIQTEELALCHKTINFSTTTNKLVITGSIASN